MYYAHGSHLDGSDAPENYRIWTFDRLEKDETSLLTISEDNNVDPELST